MASKYQQKWHSDTANCDMINTREDVKSAARGNLEQGTVKRREIWLMKQFSCRTYALNKPDAVASITTKENKRHFTHKLKTQSSLILTAHWKQYIRKWKCYEVSLEEIKMDHSTSVQGRATIVKV